MVQNVEKLWLESETSTEHYACILFAAIAGAIYQSYVYLF